MTRYDWSDADSANKEDRRQFAPSAQRNAAAIKVVLTERLPHSGTVLEIASGTGQHIVEFAESFPALQWRPSDPDSDARASIDGWARSKGLSNLLDPLDIDVSKSGWEKTVPGRIAAIYASNLMHISPWAVGCGLLGGAGRLLPLGALLMIYGAFSIAGRHISQSNVEFDASLKARNGEWGVRDSDDISTEAEKNGLSLIEKVAMPSNNLLLVLRRQ